MNDINVKTKKLDANTLWKAVLAELQVNLSGYVFNTWVQNTQLKELTDNTAVIYCGSEYQKTLFEKNYRSLVQESINKIGQGNYNLEFKVGQVEKVKKEKQEEAPLFENSQETETEGNEKATEIFRTTGISSQYTFDKYIMGNNNRLAYSIAWAVSTNPGITYNPVFIYSGVGLGKTHLIQAIGNRIIRETNLRVVYTTGESFTNELIETIQRGKRKGGAYSSDKFRDKYRNADVLLVDDIQFIAGRESTQEEFFHTFNALYMAQKQIVITSDRPPKDFVDIEERITSRFSSGLIADIQSPDVEVRTAILRDKRDRDEIEIPNEVLDFVAEKVNTNVRELEGVYLQIVTKANTQGAEIDLPFAAEVLGATLKEEKTRAVNPNQIIKAVCNYYSITGPQIKGRKRTKDIALPRQIAMYLIRELTPTPFESIGDFLGGRDHSTVIHGCSKIEDGCKEEERIKQDVANVKQLIFTS